MSTPSSSFDSFAVAIAAIRFEHQGQALGMGVSRPRLSWLIEAESPAHTGLSIDSSLDELRADPAAWNTVLFWLLARASDVADRIGRDPTMDGSITLRQALASTQRPDKAAASFSAALVSLRM